MPNQYSQSELYRDMFEPGWREAERERAEMLMQLIPERKSPEFGRVAETAQPHPEKQGEE